MIRAATRTDLDVLVELIQALAEYEHLSEEVILSPDRVAHDLFGDHPVAEVLVAEEDSHVVGFALFFTNYSTFLGKPGIYLEDLFVRPTHRGRGYGKQLLLAVARLAVARDCGRMEWSVLDWNQPSIDFYESLGAVAMREWTIYRLTGQQLRDAGHSSPRSKSHD